MGDVFVRAMPAEPLPWTGERLTTATQGQVEIEHLHRYAFARPFCVGRDVLDVASGEGYGTALLAQVARSAVGVEISPEAAGHASRSYVQDNLRYLIGDARAIPLEDASVDVVVSFETIEHFAEHAQFLLEVKRVLRPGGQFIVSSPDRDVYSPPGSPPNPYHIRELTRAEFQAAMDGAFAHVRMVGQRTMLGSVLIGDDADAGAAVTVERVGAGEYAHSEGLPRPMYLVAVGSDAPLGPLPHSLFIETGEIGAVLARADGSEAALQAARAEVESYRVQMHEQHERAVKDFAGAVAQIQSAMVQIADVDRRRQAAEERAAALTAERDAAVVREQALAAAVRAAVAQLGGLLTGPAETPQDGPLSVQESDRRYLSACGALDAALFGKPGMEVPGMDALAAQEVTQWASILGEPGRAEKGGLRRACAGFHPLDYGFAHPQECVEGGIDPVAHWLRAGRPAGSWAHTVLTPLPGRSASPLRAALHAHFFYPKLAADLRARLEGNDTACDLFLTTDTPEKASMVQAAFKGWPQPLDVTIVPNRGRDIGPFLDCLRRVQDRGYDMLGHLHGKRSEWLEPGVGDRWRDFLWESLAGPGPMLDTVAQAFAANPALGLVIAEDPHLVGWDSNRAMAERLAARMRVTVPLPTFFDFPLGSMFWARPHALTPLLSLNLRWIDYPVEPLPGDGTILHALERLMPFVARHAGFDIAGIRAPGTTW